MEQFTLQGNEQLYLYAKTTGTSPNQSWLVNLKVIHMGTSDLLINPTMQAFGKRNSVALD